MRLGISLKLVRLANPLVRSDRKGKAEIFLCVLLKQPPLCIYKDRKFSCWEFVKSNILYLEYIKFRNHLVAIAHGDEEGFLGTFAIMFRLESFRFPCFVSYVRYPNCGVSFSDVRAGLFSVISIHTKKIQNHQDA